MTISCQEAGLFLADYLIDRVGSDKRFELEEHLAGCSGCDRSLNLLRDARDAMSRELSDVCDPGADQVPDSLLKAIVFLSGDGAADSRLGLSPAAATGLNNI